MANWIGGVDSNWSTANNWSTHAVPGPSDTADFSGNVSLNSTATVDKPLTVGSLIVDGTWLGTMNVNNALTVSGNFQLSSGTFNQSAAISIGGSGSIWNGGQINLGTGGFSNTGTLAASTLSGQLNLNGNGTFTNSGTMTFQGGNFRLENGATFQNAATTGIFNITDNSLIVSVGSPAGTFINAGTLEKTGGTGTGFVQSNFSNSGTIAVTTGTLAIAPSGGQNTGGIFNVSSGAMLDLTNGTTVHYTGTYTGTGTGVVSLNGGTLAVDSGGATFNMAGSLFKWTGTGTIDVTNGNFTNTGTITISTTGTATVNGVTSGNTTTGQLINSKTINQTGAGKLQIQNGATVLNKGTYSMAADVSIVPGGTGPDTFTNTKTLQKSAGTGTSTISCILNNTGTVLAKNGTLSITGSVTQISGTTMTAGTWNVTGTATVHPTLTITTMFNTLGAKAKVTLTGPNVTSGTHQGQPVFSNLASVRTIAAGGHLTLTGGVGLVLGGGLTNNGFLTLNTGDVLTINGAFTEGSTATLTIQLGGTSTVPSFGQIVTAGPVVLAGKLVLKEKTTNLNYTPPQTLQFITNTGVGTTTGNFTNLPDGSTITVGTTFPMTFTIHYGGGNGNDVTLTL